MNAEQYAHLEPVDRLDRVFNDVASMYNDLWLVRHVDMPDDILSESYTRFTDSIALLSRIALEQASQHERDARVRAREERARLAAERLAAEAVPVPAPVPAPVPVVQEVIVLDHADAPLATRQVRQRRCPARKIVALKKTELNQTVDEPCCICMEEYTRINSVITSCGHAFCKGCYDQVEQTGLASATRKVCCPICRERKPKITEYRARKGGNVVPPHPLLNEVIVGGTASPLTPLPGLIVPSIHL